MSVKPLNHYSLENPASVYDEEALTALELAGRTAAKVNETVNAFNAHEKNTNEHLARQDAEIKVIHEVEVPKAVREWMDEHPEASTSVLDRSLTINKLVVGTLGYITPQMFGAKGDGVTNDTQAFKDAMIYASENGLVVDVPTGVYIVSQINVRNNVHIRGKGESTIIKHIDASAQYTNVIVINEADNVIIENLCVDGNASGQTYQGKMGFQILTTNHATIRNVIVKNVNGDGITIGYTGYLAKNVTVDKCTTSGCSRNEIVLQHCEGVRVVDTVLNGGVNSSALLDIEIHANNDYIKDVVFDGCTMIQTGERVKLLTNKYTTSFSHIAFNNCYIKGAVGVMMFNNVSFTECVITQGVEIVGCEDVTFNHCIVNRASGTALYVYASEGYYPKNIRVYGCTFKDSNYGVLLGDTSYVVVHGCTIKGCKTGLNIFYKNDNTVIESCFIYNNTTGILYTGNTYTKNRVNACQLDNETNISGAIAGKTIIDGFYGTMGFANDTYGFDATLDENANLKIPTTVYTNMVGFLRQIASTGWVQNGMIFEDTDGYLKYKNTTGSLKTLTNLLYVDSEGHLKYKTEDGTVYTLTTQ